MVLLPDEADNMKYMHVPKKQRPESNPEAIPKKKKRS
jgi:hypothetical protein